MNVIEMPLNLYAAMLALGLASGMHCVGMCGGIVTAFSTRRVAVVNAPSREPVWRRQLAFNAGRIASYGLAGALAGLVGGLGLRFGSLLHAQVVLYVLANLMLVLVGLHLAGVAGPLSRIEALGAPVWRRIAPHATRLLDTHAPSRGLVPRALSRVILAGALWGWLPCGLVYTALAIAALAGGAVQGAVAMLAFGLGTLPYLLAVGVGAARMRTLLSRARWRIAAGMLVLGAGVFGMARAGGLADAIQQQVFCL